MVVTEVTMEIEEKEKRKIEKTKRKLLKQEEKENKQNKREETKRMKAAISNKLNENKKRGQKQFYKLLKFTNDTYTF